MTTLNKGTLHQALPPDVIPGMSWGPFRYRKYPVFSQPWLLWRTLFAAVIITLYGAFAGLAQLAAKATRADALASAVYFIVGGFLMATAGPAMATWVRHRRWSHKAESWGIIAAVLFGFISAAVFDYWASKGIEGSLHPKDVPEAEVKMGDLDKAKITLFGLFGGFVYFAVGGGLASFAYFSERRRMRARDAALAHLESDMRLTVLQAQIEPHFLFNTLASIRPLIRQDAAQAERALDALSQHLRATIPQMRPQSGTVTATLGQQLEICASYLTLMQVRMGSRLQHEIAVRPELRALEFPPLMLLSLVENAIKHGLEPKPGPGRVVIGASAIGTELRVSVADDGCGLKDGLSSGLGLANIREQLEVRYGRRAKLCVATQPEGGTMAEITVPLPSPNP